MEAVAANVTVAEGPSRPARPAARSAGKAPLVVGGQPRANLLPPEIILKRKQLKTRRSLRVRRRARRARGRVRPALAPSVSHRLPRCSWCLPSSSSRISSPSSRSTSRCARCRRRSTRSPPANESVRRPRSPGGRTCWNCRPRFPEGVVLDTVTIDSGTPMAAYSQSDAPLQGARVAALSFTATSQTLPDHSRLASRAWRPFPGSLTRSPGSVTQQADAYSVNVLMHINAEAFSKRFDPETIAAAKAEAEAQAAADAADAGRHGRRGTERGGELTCSSTALSASRPSWPCS